MISIILMFGCIVAAFEISLVWKVKPLYLLITETRYGMLFGILLSTFISMGMASVFGAAGMVVMGGAMLGTGITATVYYFRLIEITITIMNAMRDFARATKTFIITVRDTAVRTIARVRRFSYAVAHPVSVLRSGNPHPIS